MMFCRACGNQMHQAAEACPACGRPNTVDGLQNSDAENTSWLGLRGRISRKEYWLHYAVPLFTIPILAAIVDHVVGARGIISSIMTFVLLIPNLAGCVRRLHDRDRSGWFLLLNLLPIIGWLWVFIEISFLRGTVGPNRFGRDPVQRMLMFRAGRALP